MNKIRFTLKAFAFLAFMFAFATAAQAQATRTWVSGVGDDVNPCSRTAPCKTFAGAISKTAAGGEIDALDPGGFGAVTITKSITIDGTTGQGFGSILASGTTGVVVNDSATATPNTIVVNLRNLSINGAGTTLGTHGINFVGGKAVNVDNCRIFNFSTTGFRASFTTASVASQVFIKDTRFFNTGTGVSLTSTGAASFVSATLNNVHVEHCATGITLSTNGIAELRNSVFSFVTGTAVSVTGTGARANIIGTLIAHCGTGIGVGGGPSRITGSQVIDCVTGVSFTGGTLTSFGDNVYVGNSTQFSGGALTPGTKQ